MRKFIKYVNEFYGVDIRDLSHEQNEVEARQIYMFCLYKSGFSHYRIAKSLGLKQHGTSIYSCKNVQNKMDVYPKFKAKTNEILKMCKGLYEKKINGKTLIEDLIGFEFCREETTRYKGGEIIVERTYIKKTNLYN